MVRGKRPSSSHQSQHGFHQTDAQIYSSLGDMNKSEKANKTGKAQKNSIAENDAVETISEILDTSPKTFTIKDNYEINKPKINVEMQNPDKLDTVTEVHIKGWKIEKPMMDVFNLCFPHVERLHTIK